MYRLSSRIGEFLLPHMLAIFSVVSLFNFSQSGGYIIVSHCGLNLIFIITYKVRAISFPVIFLGNLVILS